jgi:hypothetical protein
MSAYELETIIKKWERHNLTTEQAVGQILLLLQTISDRVGKLEERQEKQRLPNKSSSKRG